MIKIPTSNQWSQTNRSDILGNLLSSFNLDLTTNLGKTRVTRTIQTTSQTVDTDLTSYPVGFKVFSDGTSKIWTVAGSKAHSSAGAAANAQFSVDATASSPVDCDSTLSDIETFNSKLYITGTGKLYQNAAGTWTNTSLSGATSAGPWPMTVYAGRLYIGISGLGKIYSTADGTTIATSSTNTIDLGTTDYRITFLRASSNRVWIGVVASSGKGYVHEWDGVKTTLTRSYRLETQGALSCVIKDDTPYIVDTNGRLMVYSGGTFKEIARFPVNNKFLVSASNTVNNRPIHPNGMTVINSKINILLNNVIDDNASSIPEFCPSGIWEYDENIGLYHKYSLSYTPMGTNTITDYGQNRLSGVGGLSEMKLSNNAANATGDIIAGAKIYTNASSTDVGIWTNDTFDAVSGSVGQIATQAFGYLITTEITSAGIKDMWQKLYAFHKKFLTASDKIIVKYRTSTVSPVEASITWLNTTAFTTSTDVSAYVEGDEVEITQGTGGGLCAHITNIQTGSGPTYIITLDETFTGVTGTAKARFQKWRKAGTIRDSFTVDMVNIGMPSSSIELKIAMLSTGKNEIRDFKLINQNQQPE